MGAAASAREMSGCGTEGRDRGEGFQRRPGRRRRGQAKHGDVWERRENENSEDPSGSRIPFEKVRGRNVFTLVKFFRFSDERRINLGARETIRREGSVDYRTERRMSTIPKCFRVFLVFLILSLVTSNGHSIWRKPGCHKVGHTRKISIPDCVEFHITTNACRGFCESWSIPSGTDTLRVNPFQVITSVGECCNIMETEDVEVKVMCLDGTRDLVFKSAKSCSCYHCKKD